MPRKPLTRSDVLAVIRQHQPVPNGVVHRQMGIRWAATAALASLLPVGVWVATTQHAEEWRVSGWVLLGIGALGLLGLLIAWLARRHHGVHAQWGLAPLSEEECEEIMALAATDRSIEVIVEDWLVRWYDSNSHLRGRDLMFLRRMVKFWKNLPTDPASDTPG
jgi:hypothetical protein